MSHSLLTADRGTHAKVVAVALVSAIVVVLVGINARTNDASSIASGPVIKANQPTTLAVQSSTLVR